MTAFRKRNPAAVEILNPALYQLLSNNRTINYLILKPNTTTKRTFSETGPNAKLPTLQVSMGMQTQDRPVRPLEIYLSRIIVQTRK